MGTYKKTVRAVYLVPSVYNRNSLLGSDIIQTVALSAFLLLTAYSISFMQERL